MLRLLAGLLIVLAPALSPPVRDALVAFEPVVAPLLFLGALVWWGLGWRRAGAAGRRRAEAAALRFLGRWGWSLAMLAFTLPLWAHWSMQPPGGVAAFAALFGHIPWSDVHAHVEGARRLLADGAFGPFSERRPLNAPLLAVRLALLDHDLRLALALQAALSGLIAWLLARTMALRFGLASSLATFAVVLGLTRDFLPTAATEPLGIALACLALAILLTPGSRRSLLWAALGLFALDTALRARPGAQFLVPLIMLWFLWLFRRQWKRALPAVAAVALVGTATTSALNRFYGSGEATFTTYPAYTFYGLTRNSNWTQARLDFGAQLDAIGTEKEVARFLYAKAFEGLRTQPGLFLRALWRNTTRFAGKLPANLSRVVTLRPLVVPAGPPTPEEVRRDVQMAWPLLILAAAAFLAFLWRTHAVERLFWLAAIVGLMASVPFVYGDAGFRGLAPVYPFLAAAAGAGLSRRERAPMAGARGPVERRLVLGSASVAAALVVVGLAGPALAQALSRRPDLSLLQGWPPGTVVLRPHEAASVVVTNVRRAPYERVARIERREFARMLELASLEPEQHAHLDGVKTPFAILSVYDHAARKLRLLVSPVELLLEGEAFVAVQARAVPGSQFLEVEGWQRLEGGEVGSLGATP